jgi:hypothetical protein
MATFITLTRLGPPIRDVLVNVDRILLVQQSNSAALFPVFEEPEVCQNQAGGTIILFGSEHTITFADTLEETTRKNSAWSLCDE